MARGSVMPGDSTTSGEPPLRRDAGAPARACVGTLASVSAGTSSSLGSLLMSSSDSCGVRYRTGLPVAWRAGYQIETISSRGRPATQGSARPWSTRWRSVLPTG